VRTPARSWSYAELLGAAQAGALELSARGACGGERVAIALPAGLAFAQALHACLLLGAIAVPVDVRLTARERAHVAAGAAVLVEEPLGRVAAPSRGGLARRARASGRGAHDLDATAVVLHTSG